jgi:hypothetical protein
MENKFIGYIQVTRYMLQVAIARIHLRRKVSGTAHDCSSHVEKIGSGPAVLWLAVAYLVHARLECIVAAGFAFVASIVTNVVQIATWSECILRLNQHSTGTTSIGRWSVARIGDGR